MEVITIQCIKCKLKIPFQFAWQAKEYKQKNNWEKDNEGNDVCWACAKLKEIGENKK